MRRAVALAAAALASAVLAGCGDEDLTVSAATSLKEPVTEYGEAFGGGDVRLSFAGSDQLAAQIRAGARPDVFLSADAGIPAVLLDDGFLESTTVFASGRLVVAVPANGGRVKEVADLARPGIRIAVGSRSVPAGAYAREAFLGLPDAVRRNVRTEEPDVAGVVAKVRAGAVDAGFVYATDVAATGGELRGIELPPRASPRIAYVAGIVKGAEHREEALRFVRGLVEGEGRATLDRAGFRPPPP